jgi:uncharacterized protein (TIGR02271 family)
MDKVVVGLYDRLEDAHRAVDTLVNEGFRRDDISLVASDEAGEYRRYVKTEGGSEEDVAGGAAAGAGIGAVIGGLGGLLVGLGALAIPGIGPVLAAGPLVSALAGAGIGAAAGGLIGALADLGIPEEQAERYAEGVRRGGTLVVVSTNPEHANRAVEIMTRFNPVDINQRYETWHSGQAAAGTLVSGEPSSIDYGRTTDFDQRGDTNLREGEKFEVVEEELRVGKREVEEGGVRLESHVTERPVEESVDVRKEHIDVERRPVDRPASPEDFDTFREGSIEVTATSEEPVVEKRARVVEEVEIRKDVEHQQETISDTVRRKDVDVERLDRDMETRSGDIYTGYDEWEPMWRSHYQSSYSHLGGTYEDFRPAYTYGHELANDDRYRGRDWSEIEADARRDWEMSHNDSPWEQFKDAVRQAWNSVTNR